MKLLIRNAKVVAEDRPQPAQADVLVEDGVILAVAPGLPESAADGARVVDATGRLVMPAMFDAHVHFREPGFEAKEDIASGSAAALNGGVTGVVMMPNTQPALDSAPVVRSVLETAARVSPIRVLTSGCITKGREGKEMAGIDGMRRLGVRMLTDDGDPVADPAVLLRAMQYAGEFGMFFASHCEVPELAGPRALNEGRVSYQLGIKGSPACSEEICMDRDIRLAHAAGTHLHIQHVSTALGAETIRWWKERGARLTAEVSPHHLLFIDEDIGDFDTRFKMNPPLRTRADREGLLAALKDGVFDLVATDHAPHTPFEKAQDFTAAPNGITGLESALVSLHHHFVAEGAIGWDLVVKRYSAEPRRLMGLDPVPVEEGKPAELLVFDPESETTFSRDFMRSKSDNTPFLDKTLKGRVDMVVLGDQVLLERG
jgi:dihydroorotase